MAEPTAQDLANAAIRAEIAARQNAAFDEAQHLADEALGSGYQPWMKLSLIPADHRETGNATPAAIVFKVYRGQQKLTDNSMFVRRMPDGSTRTADSYKPLFGEQLHEPHPTRTLTLMNGQVVPAPRWELAWSSLELYKPRSAEALAAARVKREERKVEMLAEANPLFAAEIKATNARPERKGHRR